MIDFNIPDRKTRKIAEILADAERRGITQKKDRLTHSMDLAACIAQGCDLDLNKLAAFDDFNLAHDIHGINRHLDRDDSSPTAGGLLHHFLPRCAR